MSTSRAIFVAVVLALAVSSAAVSAPVQIVNVKDFRKNELYCKAFEVSKQTSIHIKAIGAVSAFDEEKMTAYAWIIPIGSLEPVWTMDDENSDFYGDEDVLREYDSNLELEPGRYEIYYYAGLSSEWGNFSVNFDWDDLKKALEALKKDLSDKEADLKELEKQLEKNDWAVNVENGMSEAMEELLAQYRVEVTGEESAIRTTVCSYESDRTVAEILHPDHNQYTSVGFSLAKPMEVEIRAIGEIPDWSENYADYGWILDAKTRERVWSMEEEHLRWAGGADKNKMAVRTIRLPKGDYVLYYVTDDSHSYDDWNSAPPYNPEAYGIRVATVDKADVAACSPYKESSSQLALLSITRAGDNFLEVKPFRVKQPCDVRVYALGEYSEDSDEFADYAWIEREGDTRPYWLMQKHNTEPAGGASKNRLSDQIISLPKGDYVLGYVTDDSHAYGEWNAGAPYDQKNYGVTLFAANDKFDRSVIEELSSEVASADVFAKITRVGDNAEKSATFKLDKPTHIHIIAMGEGTGNEMYDYGWIENTANDDIVWEMTYRKTRPAGGADKNRICDTRVLLDAGTYRVHYVSDGSHSFAGWNSDKPQNPQYWGITVLKDE